MAVPITVTVFYEKNKHLFGSTLDWVTDTIKVVLVKDTHPPDAAAEEFYSSTAPDIAMAASVALSGETAAADGTTGEGVLNANDQSVTATAAWQFVVVYKDTGDDATSPLLFYGDAGSTQVAGDYTFTWSSNGIIRIA